MINGGYAVGDPIASPLVILDLIPVVVFEVEFDCYNLAIVMSDLDYLGFF